MATRREDQEWAVTAALAQQLPQRCSRDEAAACGGMAPRTQAGVYNATAPNPVRMGEMCSALGQVKRNFFLVGCSHWLKGGAIGVTYCAHRRDVLRAGPGEEKLLFRS